MENILKCQVIMLPTKYKSNLTLGGSINKNKLGIVINDNHPSENYNCYVDNLESGRNKYPPNVLHWLAQSTVGHWK